MEKKVEVEKKYRIASYDEETIKAYINKIIENLNLKNETTISNDDIYYDNDDILEAYNITVRQRKVCGRDLYTLKNDISHNEQIIEKEIYEFESLEAVIKFIKDNYDLAIESLYEKIRIKTIRKRYVYIYKSCITEILFDESLSENVSNKDHMIECKYVSGNFSDYEEFNQLLSNYSFLQNLVANKKELGEKHIPRVIDNPFNKPVNLMDYDKKLNIYFKEYSELLERLKKLNERKENIRKLHSLHGPLEKPVVVTISGTPRSGKTTCIDNLFEFFKKADFKTICLEEPAGLVYSTLKSKEEKTELLKDRIGFVERQLKIGEESILNSLSGNEILLCDRGVLDTYIWYDMYYKFGMMDKERYHIFLESLKNSFPYFNSFYILYANSLTSMYRDYQNSLSIEPRSTMNEEIVQKYNSSLIRMIPTFKKTIDAVKFINTSEYAKMDASIIVANDLVDTIENLYRKRRK